MKLGYNRPLLPRKPMTALWTLSMWRPIVVIDASLTALPSPRSRPRFTGPGVRMEVAFRLHKKFVA